jgi:polyphosphate kinase 2 (PPK2 family)
MLAPLEDDHHLEKSALAKLHVEPEVEDAFVRSGIMDLESHRRCYDYSRGRDAMMAATNTKVAP